MIWKQFYNCKSLTDKGTLYQLRCAVDRRNVSASSEADYNACDAFFRTTVKCYLLAAAMKHLQMSNVNDAPQHDDLKGDTWLKTEEERESILLKVCREIVLKYGAKFIAETHEDSDDEEVIDDKVFTYSTELLSYGLLYNEYSDAVREGDGPRVLRIWRYLMLIFKQHRRKNYSIESLHVLSQYHFFLSERQRQQLLWSRFVNTHGLPVHNIALDLHMEHLNRVCKSAVGNLGANQTVDGMKRVGKCVGVLAEVQNNYDKRMGVSKISGHHGTKSEKKDQSIILNQLLEKEVFSEYDNRAYKCFASIKSKPLYTFEDEEIKKWMIEHINNFKNKMYAF